jgi:hypothetical protein
MPAYQSHEDNMAEFGDDYNKIESWHMKDFTDAVHGGSARKACDDMIGNIVESSHMTANKVHGIDQAG